MQSLCKKATTTTSSFFLPCFSYISSILHVISLLRLLVRSTAGDERGVITHHGGSVSAQIDIFIRFSKLLEHGTSTWELVSTMTVLASMWRNLILQEPGLAPKDKNGLLCLAEKLLPERQKISGDGMTIQDFTPPFMLWKWHGAAHVLRLEVY